MIETSGFKILASKSHSPKTPKLAIITISSRKSSWCFSVTTCLISCTEVSRESYTLKSRIRLNLHSFQSLNQKPDKSNAQKVVILLLLLFFHTEVHSYLLTWFLTSGSKSNNIGLYWRIDLIRHLLFELDKVSDELTTPKKIKKFCFISRYKLRLSVTTSLFWQVSPSAQLTDHCSGKVLDCKSLIFSSLWHFQNLKMRNKFF